MSSSGNNHRAQKNQKTLFARASSVFFSLTIVLSCAVCVVANGKIAIESTVKIQTSAAVQKSTMPAENRVVQNADRSLSTLAAESDQPQLKSLVQKWFGAKAELAANQKNVYFAGDFNGDGKPDAAIILRLKVKPDQLDGNIEIVNPWLAATDADAVATDTESEFALAIVHGSDKNDWQKSKPAAKFLLLDAVYDEMKLVKKSVEKSADLPAAAAGDCIFTGTESASGMIYWDGETYRWEQAGD